MSKRFSSTVTDAGAVDTAAMDDHARSAATMAEEIVKLRAERDALAAKVAKGQNGNGIIRFKVTDGAVNPATGKAGSKGAVSIYGLARFPLTLYPSQWEKLAALLAGELKGAPVGGGSECTFDAFFAAANKAGKLAWRE